MDGKRKYSIKAGWIIVEPVATFLRFHQFYQSIEMDNQLRWKSVEIIVNRVLRPIDVIAWSVDKVRPKEAS